MTVLAGENIFWFAIGAMSGVAAALAFAHAWRLAASGKKGRGGQFVVIASGLAFMALAIGLYMRFGSPQSVAIDSAAPAPHVGLDMDGANADGVATSMEAAIERLKTRLASAGGLDADWELLAQSYEFAGDTAAAALARKHQVVADDGAANAAASAADAKANSPEAVALLERAAKHRREREFAKARAAYEQLIAMDAMTSDAWADYADALGSLHKGLKGAPAAAIDKALALNANNTKALWLKASLAHEEQRYADAVPLWRKLRALLPAESSDAAIIDANIKEATELAGASAASPDAIAVTGEVDVTASLRAKAPPGSTLFIYAKSVDSPGPPLAVFRTSVQRWPVTFRLDDTMAMMPSRTLSSAKSVLIEARISRTGQAQASAGDLQAPGVRIDPRAGKPLQLTISKEIG